MISRLWDVSAVYRLWQLPFERRKFQPVARALAGGRPRSVLDVGCGPGTNAAAFADVPYVGVDVNDAYVASARRRFGDRFLVGDVTSALPDRGAPYDVVLVNSLLHHLDDDGVRNVLRRASKLLAPEGAIHILDLELPPRRGVDRWLALHDRGDHPRLRARWQTLLAESITVETFEPYPLGLPGFPLWNMFHCVGSARPDA
jgi:SAM-dependent methyltransferase